MSAFEGLRHFTSKEAWGDANLMDRGFLLELDNYREFIRCPVHVICGTQGRHADNSAHYIGRAADICFPDNLTSLLDLYLAAERFGFTNIGIYPYWKYNYRVIGGLHLDTGPTSECYGARWLGVPDPNGKQIYLQLNMINLRRFGVV